MQVRLHIDPAHEIGVTAETNGRTFHLSDLVAVDPHAVRDDIPGVPEWAVLAINAGGILAIRRNAGHISEHTFRTIAEAEGFRIETL